MLVTAALFSYGRVPQPARICPDTCRRCGLPSFNPNDVLIRFVAECAGLSFLGFPGVLVLRGNI